MKTQPVRMCVQCRSRLPQATLLRLQCHNKQLGQYSGVGRSFYLCDACLSAHKLEKTLSRQCKTNASSLVSQLKEIISDVR